DRSRSSRSPQTPSTSGTAIPWLAASRVVAQLARDLQHRVVDVTVDGAQQLDIAPEVDEIATERRWRGVADLGEVDRQPLLRSFAGGPLLADALLELRHLPVPHPYLSAQLLELRLALLEEVDAPAETRQL